MATIFETLHHLVDNLSEEQANQALILLQALSTPEAIDAEYDPEKDQMVGSLDAFFGPDTPDIASRVKEIIRGELNFPVEQKR